MDYMDDLMIGDTVYVNGEGDYRGKIIFIGNVHFSKGLFAGIVLDHPLGNHDGVYKSRRYFQCEKNHGILARVGRVTSIPLVPATNDNSRCGLYRRDSRESSSRESSPSRSFKSASPVPSVEFLKIGERVIVASSVGETKTGILKFLGNVHFADGEWAGIELFHPVGKNDGTVRGMQYFSCPPSYGLFVPSYKVESSPANKTLGNKLGTKANVHRILQYTPTQRSIHFRAGSIDDDFY